MIHYISPIPIHRGLQLWLIYIKTAGKKLKNPLLALK